MTAKGLNTEPDKTCRTIKANYAKIGVANFESTGSWGGTGVRDNSRIRKLTPRECFRFMGFDDEAIDKLLAAKFSNTRLYKMAGNSIVVDVLKRLFAQIFVSNPEIFPEEKEIKYLSLFSGIGAFERALERLNRKYTLVGYSEIDPYPAKAYSALHGLPEELNLGDVAQIETEALPADIDLITYGFPCQDLSAAGQQAGFYDEDGNHTRSGLFFEALRIIREKRPKVAIAENVKALTQKKFSKEFQMVLDGLAAAGYKNYWQVLNAKDYGVPQHRERVFIVSIRDDIESHEPIFPVPIPLEKCMEDLLEPVVDEKYYINSERAIQLCRRLDEESDSRGR